MSMITLPRKHIQVHNGFKRIMIILPRISFKRIISMIILPRNSGTLAELELARSVVDPEMISSRSGQVKIDNI